MLGHANVRVLCAAMHEHPNVVRREVAHHHAVGQHVVPVLGVRHAPNLGDERAALEGRGLHDFTKDQCFKRLNKINSNVSGECVFF